MNHPARAIRPSHAPTGAPESCDTTPEGSGAGPVIGIHRIPLPTVVCDRRGQVLHANPPARAIPALQSHLPRAWMQAEPIAQVLSTAESAAGRPPAHPGLGGYELSCSRLGDFICIVLNPQTSADLPRNPHPSPAEPNPSPRKPLTSSVFTVAGTNDPPHHTAACCDGAGELTDDVSRRAAMAETLRDALNYKELFDRTGAMVCVATFDGYFTQLNSTWSERLGWTNEELMARPFIEFVHPDDRETTLREAAALTVHRYSTTEFCNRYLKKDGGWLTLRWMSTSDFSLGRIYAIANDITRAVAHTKEVERMAMIAARTTNAVLISNARGEIEWTNASFSKVTGFSLDEARGSRPGTLLQGPDTDPETVDFMRRRIEQHLPFESEVLNYRKDGKPYWIAIEAKPLTNADGQFTGYMAVEADITAKKQAEAALIEARDEAQRLANEARAAAEAKSAFLAMMSHELRTPMNGILGTAQLLADSPLDPDQRQLLQTLHHAGDNLLALLNDILDYSKLESGLFEIDCSPFPLPSLLESCRKLFRPVANKQKLAFEVEIHPEVTPTVVGDEQRLRQVLVNLLGNAFKFTETGRVVLRALPLQTHAGIRLEVLDTGIGIPEGKQNLLFRPFSQLDASTSRRFGGTGLGLAICHRIVQAMDGTLGVTSTVGQGSTFWVELPLPSAPSPQEESAQAGPPPQAGQYTASVLLAEDNPVNTLVATRMLERLGCRVVQASDGEEALRLLRTARFDLVLMDCHMPRMDGFEATRRLRSMEEECALRRLPVIAHTASCMPEEVLRCREAGMDDLLAKPVKLAQIGAMLEKWAPT